MTRSPSACRASKGAQASGGTRASEAPASGCPWSPAPRAPRASRTQATAAKRKNARRRAAAAKPQAPRHVLGRKGVPRMPSAPAAAAGGVWPPPHPKATFPRRPPALGRVPKRLTVCACPCVCGSESLSLLLPLLRSHPFHLVARNAPEAPAQMGGAGIVLFCLVPKLYK